MTADNYTTYTGSAKVTISAKQTQTITASDVTATYGDTDKKVTAATDGNGAISYAVKNGSGDYIGVDAATGALTIKKVPADGKAYVVVTAAGTATYEQATKEVTVTIGSKVMTVSAADVTATVDGQPHGVTVNVTAPATGYTVKYGTEAGSYTLDASPTQTEAGTKTVYYQVTADNYTTYTGSAKVTISAKQTQTITASDVTATYGDTDKKVTAATDGNGAISYAVKDGSGDYIGVDAATGALTIKKVPADGKAYVTVTAAGTATHEQATRDVTVTINKAKAVTATVTANNRTYDGTEKPLVTVTGQASGGEMQYALGTATEATQTYTTSIPTGTDAGTYYVWYKVVGGDNHSDTTPASVTVTITATEKIREEVRTQEGAPKTQMDMPEGAAEDLLTPQEKEQKDAGKTVVVYLDVTNIEDTVSEEEKALVVAAALEQDSQAQVGMILDLSLFKQVGDGQPEQISEVSKEITTTITVPEELRKQGRKFFVVRIHEGETAIVGVGAGETIDVKSKLFSTYAICYVDEPEQEPETTHYIILTQKGTNKPETVAMGEKVIVVPKYANDEGWPVSWLRSSNRRVADIDPETGEMTLKKAGKTTIRVKAKAPRKRGWKTVSARVRVTVVDPTIPTKISIDQGKEISVYVGKEDGCQLTVTAEPIATASNEVTWKSSRKSVVDVDANGKLTPKKTGKAKITVTSKKDKKRKASITVKVADLTVPTGIALSTESGATTLTVGETIQLKYELTGPDAEVPASSNVTWKSRNTRIARVSRDGLVTAKKPGTVEIIAKTRRGNVIDSITLTVQPAASNSESDEAIEAQEDVNAAAENVEAVVETAEAELEEN